MQVRFVGIRSAAARVAVPAARGDRPVGRGRPKAYGPAGHVGEPKLASFCEDEEKNCSGNVVRFTT